MLFFCFSTVVSHSHMQLSVWAQNLTLQLTLIGFISFRCPTKPCQRAQPFNENIVEPPLTEAPPQSNEGYIEPLCLQVGVKDRFWSQIGDYYCQVCYLLFKQHQRSILVVCCKNQSFIFFCRQLAYSNQWLSVTCTYATALLRLIGMIREDHKMSHKSNTSKKET